MKTPAGVIRIDSISTGMDFGHYNCRDYHISPHFAATTIVNDRSPLNRHESFDELEQRSRSPASLKPKFPLLQLPPELRQQILRYLLPRTYEHTDPNPLANHARNFSAVKKRGERGMVIPKAGLQQRGPRHVVWRRGNVSLLCVCRQLHAECAEMLYGNNTFLLFVTYSGITFRFNWLLPSGLTPSRRYDFLELLPSKYLTLIKHVIINVDHVDSYTGMIKFNVSGKGLTHGLRKQVQRLVFALQPSSSSSNVASDGDQQTSALEPYQENKGLTSVNIRVSNGSSFLEQIKSDAVRQLEGNSKASAEIEEMLLPFSLLTGVREVAVSGVVTELFARKLESRMRRLDESDDSSIELDLCAITVLPEPQLCVYGNDI